jgi:DNA invertase Pin-like site-specific DNA recombinase
MKIGYARVSTDAQDLTAQRNALATLGVAAERIYVHHGLTGTNRDRPGLREALAACRACDTLVVTKLHRLVRSLPDARDIVEELTEREVQARPWRLSPRPDQPRRSAPRGDIARTLNSSNRT